MKISIVSQEPNLYARTVKGNIAYGLEDATFDAVVNAATMGNAHEFIMRTPNQYDTECGERGIQISGLYILRSIEAREAAVTSIQVTPKNIIYKGLFRIFRIFLSNLHPFPQTETNSWFLKHA